MKQACGMRLECNRQIRRAEYQLVKDPGVSGAEAALRISRDCIPAIMRLRSLRPQKPERLRMCRTDAGTVWLQWDPAKEEGIRWTVVRRLYRAPRSLSDGEILTYDNAVSEYEDISAPCYLRYGYAVFAERCGIWSDPAVTGKG